MRRIKAISLTLIILVLLTCFSGCDLSKIIAKRRATKVMDALVTLNSKKIKTTGNYSDEALDVVDILKANPYMEVIRPRLSYEIDEENITTKDGVTYCDVDVKMPYYEKAYVLYGNDVFAYAEEIKNQSESDYLLVPVTLEFKDKMLINGDEVFDDMFASLIFMFEPSSGYTGNTPVIYEDANVKLKFLRLDSLGAHFLIKNYTDYEIFVTPCDIAINGQSYNKIDCFAHIDSGEVGEVVCKIDIDYTQPVGTIAGHFHIQSTDFDSLKAAFTLEKTVIDDSVSVTAPIIDGTLIYEDANLRLAYKETTTDKIIFNVENLTSKSVRLGIDTLSINGKNITGLSVLDFQYVAPQSVGEIRFDIPYGAVSDSGVAKVAGKFKFYSYDNKTGEENHTNFDFDSGILDDSIVIETGSDGILFYQDSNVKIYYKELSSEGIVFDVENLTDYDVTLVAESVSVNGQNFVQTLCGDVFAANSLGTLVSKCDLDPSTSVGTLSAFFRYSYDVGGNVESNRFPVDTLVIDSTVEVTPPTPEGTLLYEDRNVRIYYGGVTEKGLAFDVENLTSHAYGLNCSEFYINFKEYTAYDAIISGNIAPHSIGTVFLKPDDGVIDENVKVISGTLHVVDESNYSSYDAEVPETKFS